MDKNKTKLTPPNNKNPIGIEILIQYKNIVICFLKFSTKCRLRNNEIASHKIIRNISLQSFAKT